MVSKEIGFLDRRKRAKMQWIQDPSQSKVDNLNSVRREVSRHIRNKKKAYLRAKIEELETNLTNEPSGSVKCGEFLD